MLAGEEASIEWPALIRLICASVWLRRLRQEGAAGKLVSVASVVKLSQRFRSTGSAAAKRMGGNRPRSLAGERDWLLARLAARPDLTLRALVIELGERGVVTRLAGIDMRDVKFVQVLEEAFCNRAAACTSHTKRE
jgi:hypothetical protein